MPDEKPPERTPSRAGLAFAVGAYLTWGILPAYFLLVAPSGPFEVMPFRIVMSFVVCVLLIAVTRAWRRTAVLLRQPRVLGLLAVAAVMIYLNWQLYVIAVLGGNVVESALGYFINPLVTVLLGVFVLREKVRPVQWLALGVALAAILVIAIGYGAVPWISLGLAFSFALYGLVKKVVGPRVDPVSGLTIETGWLLPVAAVQLVLVVSITGIEFGKHGPFHTVVLLSAGIVTLVPLLLFAAGARRLPLVAVGLTQFIAPAMQFVFGAFILREDMPLERWIGFALVWVALIVLSADMVIANRPPRRAFLERV